MRLLLTLVALMTLGASPPTDNRAMVAAFADLLYGKHDVKQAFGHYVALDYIEHDPGMADGRDAAVAALTPIFATSETFKIHRILVDGDMAAIHLLARERPDSPGTAVVDLFRIRRGMIVEHWGVMQPIPPRRAATCRCSRR